MLANGRKEVIMDASDHVFAGSIPEIYDRFLVPLIFDVFAHDLAVRVADDRPLRVLETAAGTGALTRALVQHLPGTVDIIATDLNQAMLERNAARLSTARPVLLQQADALALPFADHGFDVVVCQFGAMFFPDKVAAFREARRQLKPGGRFHLNVWDEIAANPFSDLVTQAVAALFPDDPPRFLARSPHGYANLKRIIADLGAADFSAISAQTLDHVATAASPQDVAIGLCQGSPLRSEIEARDSSSLERATAAAAARIAGRFGRGPVSAPIRAHVISASA
jgi:ubiquinone/menaquinone biosynthesis C-methylase UbiE